MTPQVELTSALEAALQPQAPLATTLTEVGTLQLVFDTLLISKALAPPPKRTANGSAASGDAAAAAAARLQDLLVERLDPVDWAAYRTHMAGLIQDSLVRKGLLLGLLLRFNPADQVCIRTCMHEASRRRYLSSHGQRLWSEIV